MDLFSKFASQFKKEAPVIPEATPPEPAKELEGSQLDRYEAYRKATPDYLSLRDFKMLEAREATVEELKTMSEFDKKQRRQADKQKVLHPAITHIQCSPDIDSETIDSINKLVYKAIELDKAANEEFNKLKNSRSPEQFFKEVMNSPVNYDPMPQGMKEAQERNGVKDHSLNIFDQKTLKVEMPKSDGILTGEVDSNNILMVKDHGLELFSKLDEPIPKEKKIRVFKKDFPTPERTQTVAQRSFVGIDNGVSGSVGIIYEDGTYEFFVTPVKKEQDYTKAKKMINRVQPLELAELFKFVGEGSMVMIERPMINSTRFNASMSAIRCFEATITILETLGLPYQVEDSKAWQKALLPVGITGDDLKTASKSVGNRLFPNTKLILHPDCDGMLIANYCKSKHR
jgi:hypothetical protein